MGEQDGRVACFSINGPLQTDKKTPGEAASAAGDSLQLAAAQEKHARPRVG